VTDVKPAADMGLGDWQELLDPYGWAQVETRTPYMGVRARAKMPVAEYEIRLMIKASDGYTGRDEWAERALMLDRARQVVEAVTARGFILPTAPQVYFGGEYRYRLGQDPVPDWIAEAELSFRAIPPSRRSSP
jgi:hypothetical protein